MSDLRDLIVRWQRGWGVARGLPAAADVGGALRSRCRQPGREVEYVALDADEDMASLAGLAGAIMGALAESAVAAGAETGVLVASGDGRRLYATLGWQPVAEVVIATPPGTTYPS